MQKRKLGKSSFMVSPISIGCWSFGGGTYWGSQDQKDVDAVVHEALDRGINLFDTAEAYNEGASEESLGKALKGRRNDAVIITKQVINPEKDDTIERLEAQLKRLGTDYLDILMIHWPNDDEKVMERVFESYEKLKKAGKVREFGISNFGIQQMKTAKSFGFDPCANELHYNIASRAIDKYIKPSCIENSIGIITYVSLQQGLLTGKYKTLADIAPIHARYKHFKVERSKGLNNHGGEGAEDELISLLENMQLICEEKNITMIELSLGWALRQPGITSTIVGCRNIDQLVTNMKGADIKIDDELNEYLIKLSDPLLLKLGYSPDYISPISRIK
jgi:aryl-alcohol dehydrogenase-like predicted oxidoreductase